MRSNKYAVVTGNCFSASQQQDSIEVLTGKIGRIIEEDSDTNMARVEIDGFLYSVPNDMLEAAQVEMDLI